MLYPWNLYGYCYACVCSLSLKIKGWLYTKI